MIENMDQNIGKLIEHLKQIGKYGNTLIIFTSDNGGSEAVQLPQGILVLNGVDYAAIPSYVKILNNTLSNLVLLILVHGVLMFQLLHYLALKLVCMKEGTRAPFIIKQPTTTAPTATRANTIRSFIFVTDLTPTILDYANVPFPSSTYKGKEVFTYRLSIGRAV